MVYNLRAMALAAPHKLFIATDIQNAFGTVNRSTAIGALLMHLPSFVPIMSLFWGQHTLHSTFLTPPPPSHKSGSHKVCSKGNASPLLSFARTYAQPLTTFSTKPRSLSPTETPKTLFKSLPTLTTLFSSSTLLTSQHSGPFGLPHSKSTASSSSNPSARPGYPQKSHPYLKPSQCLGPTTFPLPA